MSYDYICDQQDHLTTSACNTKKSSTNRSTDSI